MIFTAGSRRHAENVAGKLGILHLFEDIMDIVDTDFVPKEQIRAFHTLLERHSIDASAAAMFEDMPHNLIAPHQLGMATVLVYSNHVNHPVQQRIRSWTEPPEYVHHMTDDLGDFLNRTLDEL